VAYLKNPTQFEKVVELSHGKTRYLEVGDGPAVIMIHGPGFTSGAGTWLANMGPLAEYGLRVISVDEVGFGVGDRLELPFSFAYIVDFVREFQDALGLESSHIVGWSGGGWEAALLAYESPQRVDRMVMVSAGGTQTRPLASMVEFKPPTYDEYMVQMVAMYESAVSHDDAVDWANFDWRSAEAPGAIEAYQRLLDHMLNPETRKRYNTVRRLPLVKTETLVIYGDKDPVNDVSMGYEIDALLPNSKLVIFENVKHGPPLEATDRFNELVGRFLTEGLSAVESQ
jgi:pimeloyl-ACP methyl ester carboxylesterase